MAERLAPLATGLARLWVRVLVQGTTLLFALHMSRVRQRTLRVAIPIIGVSLVLAFATVKDGQIQGYVETLLALLLAMCVPAMLGRILTARARR